MKTVTAGLKGAGAAGISRMGLSCQRSERDSEDLSRRVERAVFGYLTAVSADLSGG